MVVVEEVAVVVVVAVCSRGGSSHRGGGGGGDGGGGSSSSCSSSSGSKSSCCCGCAGVWAPWTGRPPPHCQRLCERPDQSGASRRRPVSLPLLPPPDYGCAHHQHPVLFFLAAEVVVVVVAVVVAVSVFCSCFIGCLGHLPFLHRQAVDRHRQGTYTDDRHTQIIDLHQ